VITPKRRHILFDGISHRADSTVDFILVAEYGDYEFRFWD
jgi:hypothetical protein